SLSAERNGRFICTGACLANWHPLLVPTDVKPTGPAKFGTVVRPEGKTQVTFRGRPLYTFDADSKPREASGEGIRHVGTWHAATVAKRSASPTEPPPATTPGPSPTPPPAPTPAPTPPPENPYPYPYPH